MIKERIERLKGVLIPFDDPEIRKIIKRNLLDIFISSFSINILTLALPILLMQVYDRIVANKSTSTLMWLVVGVSIAIIMESIIRLYRYHLSGWIGARMEHILGVRIIDKIIDSSYRDYVQEGDATQLDRISAINTIRSFYSGQIFQVLMDLPFVVIFIITVFYLSPRNGLFLVLVMIVYLYFARLSKKSFYKANQGQVESTNYWLDNTMELLNKLHIVKALSVEEKILRQSEFMQGARTESNFETCNMTFLPNNVGQLFSQVILFGSILVGAPSVISGDMSNGVLTACMMLSVRAMQPVQNVAGFWIRFANVRIAKDKLAWFDNIKSEKENFNDELDPPEDIAGSITIKDGSFKESSGNYAFKNLTFYIKERSMVGIKMNHSHGSTALMNVLKGLVKLDEGSLYYDDFDVTRLDYTRLSDLVELIPENGKLFRGTIIDNISMYDPSKYKQAIDTARLVGADEYICNLPKGYEAEIGGTNTNISSSLLQLILLARAIINRPRILLLNNAGYKLNSDAWKKYQAFLNDIKGKITIVTASTNDFELSGCDEIYEMKNGRLMRI